MKQSKIKKQPAKVDEKISFTRFSFWFPILYGVFNVFIIAFNFAIIASGGAVQNVELAMNIQRVFVVLCLFSPSALILMLFIHRKHMNRFKNAPAYYSKRPGIFSMMVIIFELLYTATQMVQ